MIFMVGCTSSLRQAAIHEPKNIPTTKRTEPPNSKELIKRNCQLVWQNEDTTTYVDRQSINYLPGNTVRVWLKAILTQKARNGEINTRREEGSSTKRIENWDHTLVLIEIDCLNRLARLIENFDYDKNGTPILDPLNKMEASEWTEWQRISKGTYNWDIHRCLCE